VKIAVLGGSFNPPHVAHLILADAVCKELGYDKILFIPTFLPPHKEMSGAASAKDRLAMVKKLVKHDKRFLAESCEIDRKGLSYTWDTICYLEKKYAGRLTGKIGLIMGDDLAADYGKWNHAAEMAEKCQLILASRPEEKEDEKFCNKPVGAYAEKTPETHISHFPHVKVANPQIILSSTDIRSRIGKGLSWRYLVSDDVFYYIVKRKLYGFRSV